MTAIIRISKSEPHLLEYYLSRVEACEKYGLFAGDGILDTIRRVAGSDVSLSEEDYMIVLNSCDTMHKKLMEANFNEGWN